MTLSVTPIYATLFTLFFIFLSLRVAAMRRSARVSLGDGGNAELTRRMRVHGNFIEYVPLTLILMALAELQGQPAWTIHLIGLSLALGRLAHAYGVSQQPQILKLRVLGMVLTITALTAGALANLAAALA
ncbi:MAG TPA: MAPEG family protein [Dongiaceae bacterium]|nr:MAPEG family protein [Dongiaceae bacterium]